MDCPIQCHCHTHPISMELSILYFKILWFISVMEIIFIFGNSADPDEMPLSTAFYLDPHKLTMYLFTCIQNKKGLPIYDGHNII